MDSSSSTSIHYVLHFPRTKRSSSLRSSLSLDSAQAAGRRVGGGVRNACVSWSIYVFCLCVVGACPHRPSSSSREDTFISSAMPVYI
jgi:hypothetical protein